MLALQDASHPSAPKGGALEQQKNCGQMSGSLPVFAPLLSEIDPKESQEGSIDPLGMYPIADALGIRLAPGVRERQSRPRFLTAMAVSLALCERFDEERVATDEVSEPWQVFEWYAVEGLVRTLGESGRLNRLPGTEKATDAIRDRVPLSSARYLKSPRIFGFHGVYRTLATEVGIQSADRLGDAGYDLLNVWSEEQSVQGFYGTSRGPGTTWRQCLESAIEDGLQKSCTCRGPGWNGWDFFADHLAPDAIGKRERACLRQILQRDPNGYRREVIDFLSTTEGQQTLLKVTARGRTSEKSFHRALRNGADKLLAQLLDTIDAYETFAGYLFDAYEDCLCEMSQTKRRVSPLELSTSCKSVARAAERVPDAYETAREMLLEYDLALRFQESFEAFAESRPAADWASCLLDHHRKVQRHKPPNGKAPWFERFDDGTYMIRAGYVRDKPHVHENEYVHMYRSNALFSFAQDLGLVK